MHSIIKTYFAKHIDILSTLNDDKETSSMLEKCANLIIECSNRKNKILIAGNGGSAAQSQHFAAELVGRFKTKRRAISAFALSTDSSIVTCVGNDFGYEKIFSRQIEGHANEGDVFIGFTTSGKSKNIIEALYTCKLNNVTTIVFTGITNNDNDIEQFCNHIIRVPSEDSAIIQDFHHSFVHLICEYIDSKVVNEANNIWEIVLHHANQYKYLILDRDGVINQLKPNGYITNWSEFVFSPYFLDQIGTLSQTFEKIYIVSNQRGVGKGLMSEGDLNIIHKQMIDKIEENGGRIDGIYVCTAVEDDDRRKPNTGMAMDIKAENPHIDFTKTIVVGDSVTDKIFADKIGAKFIGVE